MQTRLGVLENLKTIVPTVDLRQRFRTKPLSMHRIYQTSEPMKFPAAIANAYAKIWSGKYPRIIIKAPRGGGKSKILGTVGFDYWYLKGRKVVNMGGSFVQAQIVYNYFKDYCDIDASIDAHIQGVPKMIETKASEGHTFSCVTASTKQTRGKHPDVFISDETCETSDELIHSALPMVDSSQNPLVIMASTFHKVFGVFQETWDEAEERGYLRIQWDIFDVCKTFPADFWDRPDIRIINGIEKLKAHAKGRTGDPEGWVPIENVIQAWKEKPTEDWFEVEYLGSRPGTSGLVLKPEDVDAAMFDSKQDTRYNYIQGATCVLGIDWGFSSMTSVVELMGHLDDVVVMLANKNYHQISSDTIIKDVVKRVREHGIRFIYADSAGKFENDALQNALNKEGLGCKVIEVVFSKEKVGMLGNLRAHFEQKKYKIPREFYNKEKGWVKNLDSYWQYKRYRYEEGSDRPVKKDDHIPDATMCAMQHFKLSHFARPIAVQQSHARMERETEKEKVARTKPITSGLLKKTF